MSTSTNLTLPFLTLGQAQKHVTVNESLLRLDALVQLAVVSATTSAQPGSPTDGQVYILPSGKTGADWGAMANYALAYYRDGAWEQISPREGFLAFVKDTDLLQVYSGSAWINAGRERLTANRTYYVRTDGSDANTGLSNTAGGAFLTLQKAVDSASAIDAGTYDVTVQVGSGAYTGAVVLKSCVGSGVFKLTGDTTTPANVVISTTSADAVSTAPGARWSIEGFKLQTTTSGYGVQVAYGALTISGKMEFGACANNHVLVANARLDINADYTINGAAQQHLRVLAAGYARSVGRTVTLSGTLAFTTFASAARGGVLEASTSTYSGGTITGKRYDVTLNGLIDTGGGGANYFPGNAAGTAATQGLYN